MQAYAHFRERHFGDHYRQEEVTFLRQTIKRRRSLFVAGLSGMGKSNLARFFVSHPELQGDSIMAVYVDCNLLIEPSLPRLYMAIIDELDGLLDAAKNFPAIELGSLQTLQKALKARFVWFTSKGKILALVLDRLEPFLAQGSSFCDPLRALRDLAGKCISYIPVVRQPFPPDNLEELGELFEAEPLWIGPLNRLDTFDSIERDRERLDYPFSEEQKRALHKLTGGHPGLLKNACESVSEGLDLFASEAIEQLLHNRNIQNECTELWSGLADVEKDELMQKIDSLDAINSTIQQSLYRKGILARDEAIHSDNIYQFRLFSSVFEYIIRHDLYHRKASQEKTQIEIRGNKVFINNTECTLSEKEYALFELLYTRQGECVTYDEIILHVWPESKNVLELIPSEWALYTLKRSLERKLKDAHRTDYIKTHRGRGYELLE